MLIYVSDQIALAIERTRTHNLLISREERYRLLFDKAADLIAIIDPQGKVLDTNNILKKKQVTNEQILLALMFLNPDF